MPNTEVERYLRRATATGPAPHRRRSGRKLPEVPRLAGAGITDVLDARKAAG